MWVRAAGTQLAEGKEERAELCLDIQTHDPAHGERTQGSGKGRGLHSPGPPRGPRPFPTTKATLIPIWMPNLRLRVETSISFIRLCVPFPPPISCLAP